MQTLSINAGTPDAEPPVEPALYVALEADRPRAGSVRIALGQRQSLLIGRGDALAVSETGLTVPDARLSSSHSRLRRAHGAWLIEDLGSKNGTRINGQPRASALLADKDVVQLGHTFFVFRAQEQVPSPGHESQSLMPEIAATFARLDVIAKTDITVRIDGESGVGKERIAQWLHQRSARSGAFIAVNCGALTDSLVESLLFGHLKGAFSGADDAVGFIRSADRGTLFLDEVGDLRPVGQTALLRVLQEREVTPVGATSPRPVDFRLVSATHRNLARHVREGTFREDLFARLSGLRVSVPPLRERLCELGSLIASTVTPDVRFSLEAAHALMTYDWPMNVRQLVKAVAVASSLALARDAVVRLIDLPDELTGRRPVPSPEAVERAVLVNLLRQHQGNVSAVARDLGKARMQIQRWMKQLKIDPAEFRRG